MSKLILFTILSFLVTVSIAQTSFSFLAGIQKTSVSPDYLTYPDTTKKSLKGKVGVEFGIAANFEIKNGFSLRVGVLFSAKGSNWTQIYDTTDLVRRTINAPTRREKIPFSENTILTTNYIDAPVNLLYSLPLSKKIKFVIGAGPMLSLIFSCKAEISTISFTQVVRNREPQKYFDQVLIDLPVGKSPGSVRIAHLRYNAFAGLDLGKISLAFKYSQGINEFLEDQGRNYKHKTLGITLGINIPGIDGKGFN